MVTTAIPVNLSMITIGENEITKRLAAYAALVAVPTMIAGIYGMNFEHMPELKWVCGYPFALGLMVVDRRATCSTASARPAGSELAHPGQCALQAAHHLGQLPPFIIFIIFCICSNCLSRRLTSCTCTPAPAAMRRLREALISSGLRALLRRHRIDDALDAAHLLFVPCSPD